MWVLWRGREWLTVARCTVLSTTNKTRLTFPPDTQVTSDTEHTVHTRTHRLGVTESRNIVFFQAASLSWLRAVSLPPACVVWEWLTRLRRGRETARETPLEASDERERGRLVAHMRQTYFLWLFVTMMSCCAVQKVRLARVRRTCQRLFQGVLSVGNSFSPSNEPGKDFSVWNQLRLYWFSIFLQAHTLCLAPRMLMIQCLLLLSTDPIGVCLSISVICLSCKCTVLTYAYWYVRKCTLILCIGARSIWVYER